MAPHKSRQYCTILDLSFGLQCKKQLLESVNSSTVLNQVQWRQWYNLDNSLLLQHLIAKIANNHNTSRPFYFAKLDIKDGFWRMGVSTTDAWNFCDVCPSWKSWKP